MIENIVKPLFRRTGSILSGALIGWGMSQNDAVLVAEALIVLGLWGIDLTQSYFERKKKQKGNS